MITHSQTTDFHDKMVAGLRMFYKYEELGAKEFNEKMGNENAVNLLWIILDNDLAYSKGKLFDDSKKYRLTDKGKELLRKALRGEINFNNYDLLVR